MISRLAFYYGVADSYEAKSKLKSLNKIYNTKIIKTLKQKY